jgi:acetyl esterase/lipase
MTYPFDPELAAALAMMPEVGIEDVAAARAAQAAELVGATAAADTSGVDVAEVKAAEVPLRLYRPLEAGDGPLPVVYSVHGGGFVLGSPDVDHDANLLLCRELGALIVSPDYRLAPEHPFPAGLEDCYTGLRWIHERAGDLGLDAGRIAVLGDSAGAALATAVALLARERGGPPIRFQVLGSPSLDDRLRTPSARRFTDTPVWTRRNAEVSWAASLGADAVGTDAVPALAAPARAGAAELTGMPPAYVAVMAFDPLRDEGIAYAQTLLAAGVATELHLFPGTFHGAAMVRHAHVVRRAAAETVTVLRRALAR